MWIRIKNHFTWFTENKKVILQTLKRLFRVPEIVPCDPDYETVIFMGVSFGGTDLLVYVLVPLCTRKCIRSSLGRNDVCLTLEQLSISGVYFGRKSGKNGYGDDLSITSFSSVNESMSMQGDFAGKEDQQILLSSKGPTEVKKHAHYNGTEKLQNQEFLDHPELHTAQSMSQSGSPLGKTGKDLKVVQTRLSHIDAAPPTSTEGQPIRVVRPKIMYIDHSMDVQDSPIIDRAAIDGEHHENIVKESTDIVQGSPQNHMYMYKEGAQHEKSNGCHNLSPEKKARIPAGEQEGFIVPQIKHRRDEDRKLTEELMEEHISHDVDWTYNSVPNNLNNNRKWTDWDESENGKRQISVMDFSVENNKYDDDKGGQPQSSAQTSAIGRAEAEVAEGYPSTKQNLIPVERSTSKSDGKRLYTSTATFKVNMGSKSGNSKEQPMRFVNDEIYKPEITTSLNMSQPGFDTKERSHSPSRQVENSYPAWYEDAAAEDYHKTMIPEPEPGNTEHLYQHKDFHQHKMEPLEERATPRHDSARNMHSGVDTPLYTPPSSFRDATPAGSKLVMVKTGLVDTPKQQPFIVSMDHHSIPQHGWESLRMEPNKLSKFPKTVAMPSDSFENKSGDFNFDEHGRHNPGRPDRSVNGYQQQHLTFTKLESEVLSDYADSVFTDHDDTQSGRRFAEVPPPYVAPPDYKKAGRSSVGKFSDDSVSTGDFIGSYFL